MANLKYKTKGNSSPQGKPRVYFCCHPEDFNKHFETVSYEILTKQNCTIWYYDEEIVRNEDFFADLKQMQLFVMPVTTNLLCTENEALDIEFRFAIENHIPVLPLMQENGLEELFNKKCGDLQFLDKNNTDVTAISYDEKLQKYLESVLIGDELAEKIRAAFDAYVFLSYRKKDRRYAQELMRLIHKNEFCRDIAIWYDEFLTPGENFNDSIKEALQKSGLFVLTVTPNIVNEPNYIMTTEYPMAKQEGKPILPAELVPTDREQLSEKYEDIPNPADAYNEAELSEALLESIKKMAIKENDNSPEHNFFIGLAYLGGIDVEVDNEKAVSLITSAAELGLVQAIEKLITMYENGIGVACDFSRVVYWEKRLLEIVKSEINEESSEEQIEHYQNAAFFLSRHLESMGQVEEAFLIRKEYYDFYEQYILNKNSDNMKVADVYRQISLMYAHFDDERLKDYLKKALERCISVNWELNDDNIWLFGKICSDALTADPHIIDDFNDFFDVVNRITSALIQWYDEDSLDSIEDHMYLDYARLMEQLGKNSAAEDLYKRFYLIRLKKLGDNDDVNLIDDLIWACNVLCHFEERIGNESLQRKLTYEMIRLHLRIAKVYESLGDDKLKGRELVERYRKVGDIYRRLKDKVNAVHYHTLSCEKAENLTKVNPTIDDFETLYFSYSALAQVFDSFQRGFMLRKSNESIRLIQKEIECQLNILSLQEKEKDKNKKYYLYALSDTTEKIGKLYLSVENYEQSIEYFKRNLEISLEIYKMTKELLVAYSAFYGLSKVYELNGQIELALDYYIKGFAIEEKELLNFESRDNIEKIAFRKEKIAELEFQFNKVASGYENYMVALEYRIKAHKQYNDRFSAMHLFHSLNGLVIRMKDNDFDKDSILFLENKMAEIRTEWPSV